MSFPELHDYQRLYKRFVTGGMQPREFVTRAGELDGKVALDLCAGDGGITDVLRGVGARVVMIEMHESMLTKEYRFKVLPDVSVLLQHVRPALEACAKHGALFDAAFCRQGVNYWLDQDALTKLAVVLRSGAPFIFNTFARCPPESPHPPLVKQYTLGDDHFVEVSWYEYGHVHHVQCCPGFPPHVTSFRYLSEANLKDLFAKDFELCIEHVGASLQCIARRK